MGVEYSTFRPITAAVCGQCRILNFPGCRNHKQLLSLPYGVDSVSTRCSGARCDVNTAKSRFPCVGCACKNHDIYRITLSDKELERAIVAFKHRCGVKEPAQVKLATCLLICTECSATLFPIINDKLCVANSTGQLVDEAGQAVDLALWQNHFTHCHERCPGTKGREFLARIDIVLMFSELDYAKKKIKGTAVGRWSDFKYTTGRVRSAIHYSAPAQPATGAPAPPPSSGRPSSVESLAVTVDPRQTHPVAIGVCKQCLFVNFPGCARHRTLLTKPYEVIDRQGKTTYAGCPGEGCDTNTRFANYVCAGCKGKDFSWYHIVMTDKEGDFLLKAWQGRGLGFSANSKLAHSITICNLCLCAGFPGAASKLCESKQGKLISPVTGAPMDVARWKDSHAHLNGCPGVGRVDVLMRVDMVLHGPEVQYLAQNIHASARGHWNALFVQAGHYFDPNSAAPPPAGAYPPPHSPYPPPPTTATSPAGYPPQPYPFGAAGPGGSGAYPPHPTMPYPGYDPMMAPPQTAPYGPPGSMPYPASPYPPPYQQGGAIGGSGVYPTTTGYPPAPTSGALPPPDASAYPYAAYAATTTPGGGAPTSSHFTAPPPQPHSASTSVAGYPFPYGPLSGSATMMHTAAAPPPQASAPSAPPDDLSSNMAQLSLEKEQKEDESLCVICLCEKRDVIFYKCGHLAACHDCAQQLKKHQKGCPICRQPILDIVKVYNA